MKIYLTKEEFFSNYNNYRDDFTYNLFCHFLHVEAYSDDDDFDDWNWNIFDYVDTTFIGKMTDDQYRLYIELTTNNDDWYDDCETFYSTNLKYKREKTLNNILL